MAMAESQSLPPAANQQLLKSEELGADEERLTADIIALARQYGRYGYRKIAELLEQAGWIANDKRVRLHRGPPP